MSNRELIAKKITTLDNECKIGCYNKLMENLSQKELNKVLEGLEFYDHTDIRVNIRNKEYVVEIATVDKEKDFNLLTLQAYINRYGDEILGSD